MSSVQILAHIKFLGVGVGKGKGTRTYRTSNLGTLWGEGWWGVVREHVSFEFNKHPGDSDVGGPLPI